MTFKLGKTAARPDAVTFKLSSYLDKSVLPTIPKAVGHSAVLPRDLGMLGNDQYGDCVWAGAAHETMLWNGIASKRVSFSDSAVLSDYSEVTGFSVYEPNSDQGTDMKDAASYRRKTGVVDDLGMRHKVDAYLALTPGDVNELRAAIYLFGAVGVGVLFPDYWMDQFNAGKEWTYRKVAKPNAGHYIPAFASASPRGAITVATWGRLQKMSAKAYETFNDESIAYVSLEMLNASGKSLEGFNIAQLRTDLAAITTA